jgi:2-polyprenyl-3-methyl-5-hydroxy-6-metoxy-1,4-benzoquinol methylase
MEHFLDTKDFLVSGERFALMRDPVADLLMTRPRPDDLDAYYQSEDYLSHNDTAKGILAMAYRAVKKINIDWKLRLIDEYAGEHKSLFDFGAGTGDLLQAAQEKGYRVAGVEPNAQARNRAGEKGISLYDALPADKKFQIITLWHVLEHLPDPERELNKMKDLLHDNGTLFIAVPNFNSYDARYYGEFWAAYDVPRHLWHFSKKAMRLLLEKLDLEIVAIKPMRFDAYYISLLSEKYKTGSDRYFKAAYHGWKSNRKGNKNGEHSSLLFIIQKKPQSHF